MSVARTSGGEEKEGERETLRGLSKNWGVSEEGTNESIVTLQFGGSIPPGRKEKNILPDRKIRKGGDTYKKRAGLDSHHVRS